MSRFARTQEIDVTAPASEVYAYLLDFTRHPEWADQPMTMTHVGGPATGVGARYESHVEIKFPVGHSKDDAKIEVTEAVEPKRLVYEVHDNSGHYRWTVELTDGNGTTHVKQSVEGLERPWLIRTIQPMLWGAIGSKMVGNGLTNLKARLEQSA